MKRLSIFFKTFNRYTSPLSSSTTTASTFSLLRHHHRRRHRNFSSLPLSHPIYTVWSSNTNVGKTLVSAGIASSVLDSPNSVDFHYLKPVQTGFPLDSDARFVYRKVSDLFLRRCGGDSALIACNYVDNASVAAAEEVVVGFSEEKKVVGEGSGGTGGGEKRLSCRTLFAWKEAVSPHLAVERENGGVDDAAFLEVVEKSLWENVDGGGGGGGGGGGDECWCLIETAGGVASPGPSGTLQCDLYRCTINFLN